MYFHPLGGGGQFCVRRVPVRRDQRPDDDLAARQLTMGEGLDDLGDAAAP
jgi:hypothetical protein